MRTKPVHYLPALIFAGLAIATVLATELFSGHDWVNSYGPNIAASFLELFVVAGFVEWFYRRERQKAEEPHVLRAHGYVAFILSEVLEFMRSLLASSTPEQRYSPMSSFAELRQAWYVALDETDYKRAAQGLTGGVWLSPLGRVIHHGERARRSHLEAAVDLDRYCDAQLTAALNSLMNDPRPRVVWDALLNEIPVYPQGGWLGTQLDAFAFADAVEYALRTFRESTKGLAIADLSAPDARL
jgi:hypothetical protein